MDADLIALRPSSAVPAAPVHTGFGENATAVRPSARPATAADRLGSVGGTERILFVEDDVAITDVGNTVLKLLGYRVTAVTNPFTAIAMAEAAGPFDLLITDVVLPGMSGIELAARVRQSNPTARVLFASGYSPDHLAGLHLDDASGFLQKPYRQAELGQRIREILEPGVVEAA